MLASLSTCPIMTPPPAPGIIPSAPTNFEAGVATARITINWIHDNINVDRFQLTRQDGTSPELHSRDILFEGNEGEAHFYTYFDNDVVRGTIYHYWVAAANEYGLNQIGPIIADMSFTVELQPSY